MSQVILNILHQALSSPEKGWIHFFFSKLFLLHPFSFSFLFYLLSILTRNVTSNTISNWILRIFFVLFLFQVWTMKSVPMLLSTCWVSVKKWTPIRRMPISSRRSLTPTDSTEDLLRAWLINDKDPSPWYQSARSLDHQDCILLRFFEILKHSVGNSQLLIFTSMLNWIWNFY